MIEFVVALVILGAVLYLLNLIPIDATVKQVIRVIVIVILVLYAVDFLLHFAGYAKHGAHSWR